MVIKEKEKYGILEYEKTGVIIDVSRLAPVCISPEKVRGGKRLE